MNKIGNYNNTKLWDTFKKNSTCLEYELTTVRVPAYRHIIKLKVFLQMK